MHKMKQTPAPKGRWDNAVPRRRKGGRVAAIVVSIVLLLSGIIVLLYPVGGQLVYQMQADSVNAAFAQRAHQYKEDEREDLYQRIVAYNRHLYETGQDGLVDAFSYEQVDFSLMEFGFEEEMIGYLNIPAMDIELPVYLGASRENLARGAAHLSQTSLPVGGENTNAVIAAHRGMASADMFRHIDRLVVGDTLTLTNFRETLIYQVRSIAIIAPDEIDKVLIQTNKDMITLISCNPYGYNYERYVVYTERVKTP